MISSLLSAFRCCTLIVSLFLLTASAVFAAPQEQARIPGPPDKPVASNGTEAMRKMDKAVAPYVARAKKTYPDAKARYIKGLPKGHRFFVSYPLRETVGKNKRIEQVFVAVQSIKNGKITGAISSQLDTVKNYKAGQIITFPEMEILDWTISRPDGTEEGNFVGKFLDTYKP